MSKEGILYKHIRDVVNQLHDPKHQYDKEVIEFYNSIRYLGGESTVNLLRGPGWHGQGRKGKGHFDEGAKRGNFHGPSAATCAKQQAGYTVKSGVIRDLVTTMIKLADNSATVKPLVHLTIARVYPVAIANDGTALKPGLRFNERVKRVVGLNVDVDLAFAQQNPKPTPEFLKESVIIEATVSFATTLENEVSMPFAVDYVPKTGKTGECLREKFKTEAKLLQICENCLSRAKTDEHIIADRDICECCCDACWSQKDVCEQCTEKGQVSHYPACRACTKCLEEGKECIKLATFVFSSDCEEGNKKAMETINQQVQDGSIEPELALIVALPDTIHVGKSLKCSFANWFILLQKQRVNLAILRTLRDDNHPNTRKVFRTLLKDSDAVRNKDRMAVDPVLDLTAEAFINELKDINLQ